MGKLKVTALRCERCGHVWVPELPISDVRICPKCKSARWDEPKPKGGRRR